MTFSEIIEELGIESYPAELEEIYKDAKGVLNFSEKDIDMLEREYSVIGACQAELVDCLNEIRSNSALWEYTAAAAAYLSRVSHAEGLKLKLPSVSNEYPTCYYSALLLVMAMPEAINNYLRRGFSKDEVADIVSAFRAKMNASNESGEKLGLDSSAYNWLRHYTSSVIFKTSLFGITPRILNSPLMLLKNSCGEYKIMMTGGRFHRDGKILGSAGYTDEGGAFDAEFSEDEKFYTGHEVIDSRVSNELSRLSKSEWRIVLKQGDGFAGLHIPRNAELTDERMNKSFREAYKLTVERYPDYNPKGVHCSTWLLDPKLSEILGPGSNIARFQSRFTKYPIKSGGKELFGFAFPKNVNSYKDLPENTSLQRKLKAMYINGEFICAHAGFVTDIDFD